MAIESKATFLTMLEGKLSTMLTARDMNAVLSTVQDELGHFDMNQVDRLEDDGSDLLTAYISAMRLQGRSEKTIERYKYLIGKLEKAVNVPTRMITVYHIRKYLADEKNRGISDRTLESQRQVYSAYFNWLQRECLITANPTANLGAIKCAKKIKKIFSDVDIERLKFACENIRDRAIILFLLSTGCRISEMTHLNRADIDFSTLECNVLGKGAKERTVYMDEVAGAVLKEYLATRLDDHPALFIGKGSERLTPGGVRYMLTNLCAGVDHVHPHKFRRTLATNLIRHGMPIQEVAAILGHDKLDTTMQYVVLDKSDVKNSYRRYA